jgi:site-specific recombinase XerD
MKIKLLEVMPMESYVYEENSLKYNRTELVEYKEKWKNYYEEEIKYLKETEIIAFLNGITNEFHKMLFYFLFETGARVSEVLNVRISNLDYYNKTVKLNTLKRKNKNIVRILTISDSLINKVLIYIKNKDLRNTDYLFTKKTGNAAISLQAVNKSIKKYFISILGQEYKSMGHPHTLRHSRAVQLLNSGVNIVQVKDILGHANIMNTLVYLKYSNKDIQESIRKSNRMMGLI